MIYLYKYISIIVALLLIPSCIWGDANWYHYPHLDFMKETTTLYDTVAVLCAARPGSPWLDWETLRLTVSDRGETKECSKTQGISVQTALCWRNLKAFLDWLADRLSGPAQEGKSDKKKRRRVWWFCVMLKTKWNATHCGSWQQGVFSLTWACRSISGTWLRLTRQVACWQNQQHESIILITW